MSGTHDNSHFPRLVPFDSERLRHLGAVSQQYKAYVTDAGEPAMTATIAFARGRQTIRKAAVFELDSSQPEELNLNMMCDSLSRGIAEYVEKKYHSLH